MNGDHINIETEGYFDVKCTGRIDIAPFKDDTPDMVNCNNNTFYLQLSEDGKARAVCYKCGKVAQII